MKTPPQDYVRTFTFSDTVPKGRAHFFAEDGTLAFDLAQSDLIPPLAQWHSCALPSQDEPYVAHGVELHD